MDIVKYNCLMFYSIYSSTVFGTFHSFGYHYLFLLHLSYPSENEEWHFFSTSYSARESLAKRSIVVSTVFLQSALLLTFSSDYLASFRTSPSPRSLSLQRNTDPVSSPFLHSHQLTIPAFSNMAWP